MIATIKYISDPMRSNTGNVYRRVALKSEDGKWLTADIVEGYKNAERWKKVMQKENKLYGVELGKPGIVNCDSRLCLLDAKLKRELKKKEKIAKIYAEANRLQREDPEAYWKKYLC